jgi:prepilin-type processing-associated H-X9-DG protein
MVVVAVIALLIAILLPSLANARVRARTTVCASNLRSLGVATTLYLEEYSGDFFRYYVDTGVSGSLGPGRLWWFGFEAGGPLTGSNRPLDKQASPLGKYAAGLDVKMLCPDFPYDDGKFFPKFAQRAATYGYNIKLGPTTLSTASNRQLYINRMRDVAVFADGVHFDFGATFNEGHYLQYMPNAVMASGYAHFRHPQKLTGEAQMVFLDGHVEGQRLTGPTYRVVAGSPAGNLVGAAGANGNGIYGY